MQRDRDRQADAEERNALEQDGVTLGKVWGALTHHHSDRQRQRQGEQQLAERRIRLLEQKAEQADATKKVLADGALTGEEREQRIREIYGRA